MGYVLKVFGENNMWNLRPWVNPNPITPAEITITSRGPEVIESVVNTEEGNFRVIVTGNFQYQEPVLSAAQATGQVSTFTVYKAGQLHEYEAYGAPVDLATTINASFSQQMAWLSGNDLFVASPTGDESDEIQSLAGNDTFIGYASGQWGDKFYGGDGIDTAVFRGRHADYNMKFIDYMWDGRIEGGGRVDGYEVTDSTTGRDGVDYLNNVERLRFSDTNVALDVGLYENAGMAYRIYRAAFDRAPDAVGLANFIAALDQGRTPQSIAAEFASSGEFQLRYGPNLSSSDFVELLYQNALDRPSDAVGKANWVAALDSGAQTRADLLIGFSESDENYQATIGLIGQGLEYPVLG